MKLMDIIYELKNYRPKYVYVRFGLPNKDELGKYKNSYCYYYGGIEGPSESGISVFEAEYKNGMYHVFTYGHRLNTSFDILMNSNRDLYLVDGEVNGDEGADGDILLDPCTFRVIKQIPKNKIIQER